LRLGRAHYAIACTPQGGIQMDGVMIRLSEDHFCYVHANGDFESWLVAYSDGLVVSISDPQSRVLQIQGPRSLDVLKTLDKGRDVDDFGYFHSGFFEQAGNDRGGWLNQALTLLDNENEKHGCEVVPLTFYDAEKKIPRGLMT